MVVGMVADLESASCDFLEKVRMPACENALDEKCRGNIELIQNGQKLSRTRRWRVVERERDIHAFGRAVVIDPRPSGSALLFSKGSGPKGQE